MATLLRGIRVLLPEWTVALVRPSSQLPANVAVFRVDPKSGHGTLAIRNLNLNRCSARRREMRAFWIEIMS